MAKVIVALTMSLDGFIAGANDGADLPHLRYRVVTSS
jgi:hypothetical protein